MSRADDKTNCKKAVFSVSRNQNNAATRVDCESANEALRGSCGNSSSSGCIGDLGSFLNSNSGKNCNTDNSDSTDRGLPTFAACTSSGCSNTSTSGNASGVRQRATEDGTCGGSIQQKQQRRMPCEASTASTTEDNSSSKMTGSANNTGGCDSDNSHSGMESQSSSPKSSNGDSSTCTIYGGRSTVIRNSSSTSAVLDDTSSSRGSLLMRQTPAAKRHECSRSSSSSSTKEALTDVYPSSDASGVSCASEENNNTEKTENSERNSTSPGNSPLEGNNSKVTAPAGDDSNSCEKIREETGKQRVEPATASIVTVAVGGATGPETTSVAAVVAADVATAHAAERPDCIPRSSQQWEDERGDEDDEGEDEEEEEEEIPRVCLTVKWNTKLYPVLFTLQDYECFSVADLKERLQQQLSVPADKQVINDFSCTALTVAAGEDEVRTPLHLQRLEHVIAKTHVHLLHPPRDGKKLLVLDLDYTLFDCKSLAGSIEDLKRPYLDEFLESVFKDYDIAVWSQTHWKWVEMKCTELGLLTNSRYHLCFVLDRSSMFTICSRKRKKKSRRVGGAAAAEELRTHEVKALEVIWRKFPDRWSSANTLHVDDLSRNFAFNPENGIRISAYRRDKRHKDADLLLLSMYLKMLSTEKDVSAIRHTHWKDKATDFAKYNSSKHAEQEE